ncbi:protein FAR1-RELATED SEQUENCE 5-like [Juglans regia]|uniref:Protein FAR1-RELATED SEQUENCE 5-like n=1 Tax=Juglans regia TaxID=51240 RepID=A0A6P9EBW3_JUGRE|nr:protein FAR1-RELATED SEQUENCE 5-like [Juglans regia]
MAWNRMAEWDMGMELEGIRGKLALETELLLLLIGNSLNRNRIDFRETERSLCPSLTHWINSRAWGLGIEPIYNIDSDELEAELEAKSVDIQSDVNVEDGVNVETEDRVNVIPSSSSAPLEPFIGMVFEEVEDAQAFYNTYARRQGFAIRTNHIRLSKDDKTRCAVDYVCTREGFRRVSQTDTDRIMLEPAETKIGCKAIMRIKKDGEK